MDRRSVLRGLGILSTSPLWMHVSALAQGLGSLKGKSTPPEVPKPVQTKDSPELIRVGLPSDWKLDLPKQWKSDGGVLSKTAPKGRGSGILMSATKAEDAGKDMRTGSLDPIGQAVPMTPEMSKVVGTPAGRLKLDALNQPAYNHFKSSPKDITGKPLVGTYTRPEQIYESTRSVPPLPKPRPCCRRSTSWWCSPPPPTNFRCPKVSATACSPTAPTAPVACCTPTSISWCMS
jgi:hypothetical protein